MQPLITDFTPDENRDLDAAAELLRHRRSILFITGAGLSADSGLPTYRGVAGLYENRNTDDDLPIEALMSGETLKARPELTWKYLLQVANACKDARPNRGHQVIAEMEARYERVWVLTQNVDGFHRQAGSKNVIEMHGNLSNFICMSCVHSEPADYTRGEFPPRCPECGGCLRPEVVLFGEQLPAAQVAIYRREISKPFDVVFSIGTTSVFRYISAPVLDAYHWHKSIIEINPGDTDVSEFATVRIRTGAAAALAGIWQRLTL